MDTLNTFILPLKGLKPGIRQFNFQIERSFFEHFEGSAISECDIQCKLIFDKRPNMIVLDFEIEGTVQEECDRCLEAIDLPISGTQQLMVKYSEEEQEEKEDVIYIHPESSKLQTANHFYELIHLSVPMRKVKPDCEDFPEDCKTNLLNRYEEEEDFDEEESGENTNSIWGELDNFKEK